MRCDRSTSDPWASIGSRATAVRMTQSALATTLSTRLDKSRTFELRFKLSV